MEEIWKDVKYYEDKYKVSNLGNVYSTPSDGKAPRMLKQEISRRGNHTTYRRVSLSADGTVKRFQVHRLVAKAFLDNPGNKPHINHIDNDGSNNIVTNLEWCTPTENMKHSQIQGRQYKTQVLGAHAANKVRKENNMNKALEFIGQKHGELTVTAVSTDNPLGRFRFTCTCDCGRDSFVTREKHELLSGNKLYCGKCGNDRKKPRRKKGDIIV